MSGRAAGRASGGPGPRCGPPSAAALVLCAACFRGEFLQGTPCSDDEECGPTLRCAAGQCGGRPVEANTPPVAADDAYAVEIGLPLRIDALSGVRLLDNDGDADGHVIAIVDAPTQTERGRPLAIGGDGSVDYDPGTLRGCDRFEYTIEDGHGGTATASVTLSLRLTELVTGPETLAERGLGAVWPTYSGGATPLGDVDGDGKDDLLVRSFAENIRHYVLFGADDLLPSELELTELPAQGRGFAIDVPDFQPGFFRAGDLDDDGRDDLLVSWYFQSEARISLVRGKADLEPIDLAAMTAAQGFDLPLAIDTPQGSLELSQARPAGDINGDGIDDLGFELDHVFMSQRMHHVGVAFGRPGLDAVDVLPLIAGVGGLVVPTLDLAAPDGLENALGWRESADLDGDGFGELVLAAYQGLDPEVHVIRGAPQLKMTRAALLAGKFGLALVGGPNKFLETDGVVGDLDGDGLAEIAVNVNEREELYLVRGTESGLHEIDALLSAGSVRTIAFATAPIVVPGRWDFDGDGHDDLMLQLAGVLRGPLHADVVLPDDLGAAVRGFAADFFKVSDLNGDGRADLVTQVAGPVQVLRGDADLDGCEAPSAARALRNSSRTSRAARPD